MQHPLNACCMSSIAWKCQQTTCIGGFDQLTILSSRLMETWLLSMSTVPHQRRQALDRLPSGHAPSCMLLLSVQLPKPSGTIPLSSRLWPVSKDSAAWCVLQHTNKCHASPNVMHPQIQCARKITTTPLLATSGPEADDQPPAIAVAGVTASIPCMPCGRHA